MNGELARLAAGQHGIFHAHQAAHLGLKLPTLYRHARAGALTVAHPGVFAVAGGGPTWERSLTAALLAAGGDAVVSHRSAGRLWGITDENDDTVEISLPRTRHPELRGVVVHRSKDLVGSHVVQHLGFPVTKPARVIVDLGAVVTPEAVEDAFDRALVKRLMTAAGLERMLGELSRRGRRGAGVAARMLDRRALGERPPDGMLEPRMARLLRNHGLPPAKFLFVIRAPDGRFLAEVDFAYPDIRLALEVDGYSVHGTARAMAKDFVRQNGLVPHRWHVLRFTWAQVVGEPDKVAAAVNAALNALAG